MSYTSFGRVTTEPGKHGPLDIKVLFCGKAPTHAETLYMLGGKLKAEDRYSQPGQFGRRLLLHWIEEVSRIESLAELAEICNQCQEDTDGSRARRSMQATLQPSLFR